jgi:hypothetical protein
MNHRYLATSHAQLKAGDIHVSTHLMKLFTRPYHLREGFAVSILFPVIFFLLDYNATEIAGHFVFSFIVIFSFWTIDAMCCDFRTYRPAALHFWTSLISGWLVAGSLCVCLYVTFGSLLDRWGILLSGQRGNWARTGAEWYGLCARILLLNNVIILIKYLVDSRRERRRVQLENEILRRASIDARHEALKQQVNPHFLFNCMTTLKSLTRRHPGQAVQFVDELARVYRYMLSHQNKNTVTLREEVEFARSYLYLLKIRFGNAINAAIDLPDDKLQCNMPPNTLQLLIENAVKHNIASQKRPLSVEIFSDQDSVVIRNNLQPKARQFMSSQVGLSNISQRYRLITGKDIGIRKTTSDFTVYLPLN